MITKCVLCESNNIIINFDFKGEHTYNCVDCGCRWIINHACDIRIDNIIKIDGNELKRLVSGDRE